MTKFINTLKQLVEGICASMLSSENRQRDEYLAAATDLTDLELRQRELARADYERQQVMPNSYYFTRG